MNWSLSFVLHLVLFPPERKATEEPTTIHIHDSRNPNQRTCIKDFDDFLYDYDEKGDGKSFTPLLLSTKDGLSGLPSRATRKPQLQIAFEDKGHGEVNYPAKLAVASDFRKGTLLAIYLIDGFRKMFSAIQFILQSGMKDDIFPLFLIIVFSKMPDKWILRRREDTLVHPQISARVGLLFMNKTTKTPESDVKDCSAFVLCQLCPKSTQLLNVKTKGNCKREEVVSEISKRHFESHQEAHGSYVTSFEVNWYYSLEKFRNLDAFHYTWTHPWDATGHIELSLLHRKLNFTAVRKDTKISLDTKSAPKLGVQQVDVTGYLGNREDGEYLGDFKLSGLITEDIHFIYCVHRKAIGFNKVSINYLFLVFSRDIWICIVAVAVLVAITYRSWRKGMSVIWTFCNQSLECDIRSWNPLLVFSLSFCLMVIQNIYTGEITSSTTSPRPHGPIPSTLSLVQDHGYQIMKDNSEERVDKITVERNGFKNSKWKMLWSWELCGHNADKNYCILKTRSAYMENKVHIHHMISHIKGYDEADEQVCSYVTRPWSHRVKGVISYSQLSDRTARVQLWADQMGRMARWWSAFQDKSLRGRGRMEEKIRNRVQSNRFVGQRMDGRLTAVFEAFWGLLGISGGVIMVEIVYRLVIITRPIRKYRRWLSLVSA